MSNWKMLGCLCLIAALLFVPFAAVSTAETPSSEKATPTLRVLTYNIHIGIGTDGKRDLPRIAEVIMATKPDLVALQEVDRGTRRSQGVDQPAELARLTGLEARYGKAMDHDGGEYGEAILSRLPILEAKNHPLVHEPGHEPRAALAVRVELPGTEQSVWFIGTHLDHTQNSVSRKNQAKQLRKLFAGGHEGTLPNILAGDLNATPATEEIKHLAEAWQVAAGEKPQGTWPAGEPNQEIDYIMARPAQSWKLLSYEVIDEPVASDHRPVLAVWQWVGE